MTCLTRSVFLRTATLGLTKLGSSVDEDPDVVALRQALPAYVEGKGLFSRFGGSSHFSKFIASIAKVIRTQHTRMKAEAAGGGGGGDDAPVGFPRQTTLIVSLSRLWPEVTLDDTHQSKRYFRPAVVDERCGHTSGPPIVLNGEKVRQCVRRST